jgi:hypothetical protein
MNKNTLNNTDNTFNIIYSLLYAVNYDLHDGFTSDLFSTKMMEITYAFLDECDWNIVYEPFMM